MGNEQVDSSGNVILPRPMTDRDVDDFKRAVPNRGLFEHAQEKPENLDSIFQGDSIVGCEKLPIFEPLDLKSSEEDVKALAAYARRVRGNVFAYNKTACLFKIAATVHLNLNVVYHKNLDVYYKLIETLIDLRDEVEKRTKPYKLTWDTENRTPLPMEILKHYPFSDYEKWREIIQNRKQSLSKTARAKNQNDEFLPIKEPNPGQVKNAKSLEKALDQELPKLEQTLSQIQLSAVAVSNTPNIDQAINELARTSINDIISQTSAKLEAKLYFGREDTKLLVLTEAIIYHSVVSVMLDTNGNPFTLNGRLAYPILVQGLGSQMQRNVPMPGAVYISIQRYGDAQFEIKNGKVKKLLSGGVGGFVEYGYGYSGPHEFQKIIQSYMNGYAKQPALAAVTVKSAYDRNDLSVSLIKEKISELVTATLPFAVVEIINNLKSIIDDLDGFLKNAIKDAIRDLIVQKVRNYIIKYIVKKVGAKIVPVINAASAVYDLFAGEAERTEMRHVIAYMVLAIKGTVKDDMTIAAKGLSKIVADKFTDKIVAELVARGAKKIKQAVGKKTGSAKAKPQTNDQSADKTTRQTDSDNLNVDNKGTADHKAPVQPDSKKPSDVFQSSQKELDEAVRTDKEWKDKQKIADKPKPDQKEGKSTRKIDDKKTDDKAVKAKATDAEKSKESDKTVADKKAQEKDRLNKDKSIAPKDDAKNETQKSTSDKTDESGVRVPLTKKEGNKKSGRLKRLAEIHKKGGKWADLSANDRFRLGKTFHKVMAKLIKKIASKRGTVLENGKIDKKQIEELRKKGGKVILIEVKLPSGGKVDVAEIDFDAKKAEIIDFTSLEKKDHVDKTKAYKEEVSEITGLPTSAMESRYIGDDGKLQKDLLEASIEDAKHSENDPEKPGDDED